MEEENVVDVSGLAAGPFLLVFVCACTGPWAGSSLDVWRERSPCFLNRVETQA